MGQNLELREVNRNLAFDRLRGISAVLVVLIHAPPLIHSRITGLAWIGWVLQCLCLCAVPYFFVLSGYFAAGRWEGQGPRVDDFRQSASRVLRLYCPWFLLYLALDAATGRSMDAFSVLRRFVGFSDGRLETTGYHLWFLPSLLLAHAAGWVLRRTTGSVLPGLLLGGILLVSLSISEISGAKLPWGLVPNEGLNLSLVGFCLGTWIRTGGSTVLQRIHSAWIPALAVLLVIECALLRPVGTLEAPPFGLFRFLLAAALVMIANRNPSFLGGGRSGRLLDLLGRHSTGIYVAHLAFLYTIPFDALISNGFVRDNLARWCACLALSVAFSAGVRRTRIPFLVHLVT